MGQPGLDSKTLSTKDQKGSMWCFHEGGTSPFCDSMGLSVEVGFLCQADLELQNLLPASTSQVLGSQACTTMPGLNSAGD